jgi:integrase
MLGDWLIAEWLPAIRATVEPTTFANYTVQVKAYIVPAVGGVRLSDLNPALINGLYGKLSERLGPKSVRNVHVVLHKSLRDAVKWRILTGNPADDADPPKLTRKEPEAWMADEAVRFLGHTASDRLAAMWRLAVTTGMRRGELAGVRWQDIDLDSGSLSVVRTRTEYSGVMFEKEPKTTGSRRRIALDGDTVAMLRDHRRRQLEDRLAWGAGWQETGLVFTREDGSPLRPTWITRRFAALALAAGVRRMTPHSGGRHTWATLALEAGTHPKVAADRLGHASVKTTLDRYSHVIEGVDRQAAETVAARLRGDIKGDKTPASQVQEG